MKRCPCGNTILSRSCQCGVCALAALRAQRRGPLEARRTRKCSSCGESSALAEMQGDGDGGYECREGTGCSVPRARRSA